MPDFQITGIDVFIVVAYIALTVAIGVWVGRGKQDAEGYFLGGRNFSWPLVGLSLFASNQSGSSLVGLAGSGYANGIAVFSYEWTGAIILIFFLFFFLPFYYRSGVYTMPEFLEKRFDQRSRYAFSIFLLFLNTFVDIGAALYAGGITINLLYPSIPLWTSIAVLATIAGIYTISGGLSAVVITDAIQAVVLILGSIAIAVLVFVSIDSWAQVREAAPEGGLSLIQPANDETLPWPGLFTGLFIIGIYYFCMNQFIVQRTLGARSLDHGRWGSLLGGSLKLTLLFILILPATMANVLYPNLDNADLAFPTLAFDLLPIGLRGLVLAALVAAIMSTIDSILNAMSTVITMDFVGNLRPQTEQQTLVNIGRIVTTGLMVIAVIWAPQITNFPTLWQYLQAAVSYVNPPIVAVFLLGVFWTRANRHGAFITIVVGVPVGITGFIMNEVYGVFTFSFLYAALILFVFSCLLLMAVSLATSPPAEEKVEGLTWNRGLWREESRELEDKPWYYNYRYWSVALLAVTAVIVIAFW